MVATVTTRVRGGHRLRAFLRQAKSAARDQPYLIEVGFPREVAGLAAAHEFGVARIHLPERPAFRRANATMRKALAPIVARELRRNRGALDDAGAVAIARAAVKHVRAEYEAFALSGSPSLGPAQEARKEGTPGAGRLLIGSEGPKMLDRLTGWVNGREVR